MTRHLSSILRWVAFTLFTLMGVVGLLIPVVPQIPFFIAALIVIMPESRWVRRQYILRRRRHPRFFHAIERWRRARRVRRAAIPPIEVKPSIPVSSPK
jgi:uncharacterized membrane protein YbaN (DUF454 family)